MAKQIIYLIVTAQVILSCTSTTKDPTTWSAFEEKIYNTKKDFEKSGITQPIAISSFFEGNGFEQIPCEEKTYNLSENSERNGNEVVFFVKQEGDEVGFFAITLEPFIVQCNSFNFEGQPLDFYYKGDQQYLVEEKKHMYGFMFMKILLIL